jgi:hypothetical protein
MKVDMAEFVISLFLTWNGCQFDNEKYYLDEDTMDP